MKDHHKKSLEIGDSIMSTPEGREEVRKIREEVEKLGIKGPTFDEYLQGLQNEFEIFQKNNKF